MSDSAAKTTIPRGVIRAPRGTALSCKGWAQEAALRLLMNSLAPEVGERPQELVIHAGERAARDWSAYDAIIAALHTLESDQTLLVRAGEPAGVLQTSTEFPRVVILDALAGSWLYTGTQSKLHTTYLLLEAAAKKHFAGTLAGKLIVVGGMGGAGGALALAAAWHGAAYLGIDANTEHIKRRLKGGYCDVLVNNLDEAMRILKNAVRKGEPASVGLTGNCAEIIPALAERGIVPDLFTDQTVAQDPLAYMPRGMAPAAADDLRRSDPAEYRLRALDSIAAHVRAMLELQRLGSIVFALGSALGERTIEAGVAEASTIPDGCKEYLLPLTRAGSAPVLWVALSGDTSDIRRLDDLLLQGFPDDESLAHWIDRMRRRGRFEGLPARVVWLGKDERLRFAGRANDLVARGELKTPVAFGYSLDSNAPPSANMTAKPPGWPEWLPTDLLPTAGGSSITVLSAPDANARSLLFVADGTRESGARIERALCVARP